MSSKHARARKALQALSPDARPISSAPVAIGEVRDGGVSWKPVPPIYMSQSGKEIGKGKFWFLTRLFRSAITQPAKVHKTSIALSQFHATRRRLAFYRNN